MTTQISDPTVIVNDVVVAVIPNSVKYTEGSGEQKMRATSKGGGQIEPVYSNDVETNLSMCSFEMASTLANINSLSNWKNNRNQNLVQVLGRTPEGDFDRTFSLAAILNDPEIGLGSETNIPVEFKSKPAV